MTTPKFQHGGMRTKLLRLVVSLWFAPQVGAFGELRAMSDQTQPPARPRVFRFEIETNHTFRVASEKELMPSRVYVVYHKPLGQWVYTITDKAGKLPKPAEALAPGTVVTGPTVGGDKAKRYALNAKAKWVLAKGPLQRRLWSLGEIPTFRLAVPFTEATPRRPASRK